MRNGGDGAADKKERREKMKSGFEVVFVALVDFPRLTFQITQTIAWLRDAPCLGIHGQEEWLREYRLKNEIGGQRECCIDR